MPAPWGPMALPPLAPCMAPKYRIMPMKASRCALLLRSTSGSLRLSSGGTFSSPILLTTFTTGCGTFRPQSRMPWRRL